jgi:DNA-binding response OmpR family regulator
MARVLVVDDVQLNRDMLSRRLRKAGYEAQTASRGAEALEIIERDPPDLVLLDVMMPGMDGNEVLTRLRETRSPADLPVIMVTARDETANIVESLQHGANDYVTKPVDFPVLLARVERQLAVRAEFAEQAAPAEPAPDEWPDVAALIEAGESERLEFKSTLRWNIKAGKPGKEIELAAMKTVVAYLNTDGGVLLVGVSDDGTVLGLGQDDFKSEDRCLLHVNNLLREHVGLEHAQLVRFDLRPCGDEKVLVIECARSEQPVFLRNGKDEIFFVRVGPGSRELNAREVLDYLDQRRPRDAEASKAD